MNRMCNSSHFEFLSSYKNVIFIVLMNLLITNAYEQIINDYPEVSLPEAEMVHDRAGAFIKLKCEVNNCNKNNIFKWEFKTCGPDLPEKLKCHNKSDHWITIHEKRNLEHCSLKYVIKKSTGSNSGLYRCSIVLPEIQQTKFIKVYQVHVVEPYTMRSGTKPELYDIQPVNITISENMKIVIQCRVYSDFIFPPEIWWLKQVDVSCFKNPFAIHDSHNNKTYVKLKSSQMALGNFTYVSKLIIEKCSENDRGIYTCFAVNLYGNSSKDVVVDVVAMEKNWQGTTSFSILFLIPLGFALIPISGWLCVYYYRRKKLRKLQLKNLEYYKYQPILNQHNLIRHNATRQGIV